MTESLPVPFDVKLMNMTASVLFTLCGVAVLVAFTWWTVHQPIFGVGGIVVEGEVTHNNALTLRANVAPKLQGGFFTMDLADVRSVFETVPWVRRATVRREFPNVLRVQLQEHHPVALWGTEEQSTMVNTFGEVFEANMDELEQDDLPRLQGPADHAPEVLAMYRRLAPLFEPLDMSLDELSLSSRGGWRGQLDNGAVIELGSGSADTIQSLVVRFVQTLTQVAAKYNRRADALESADLRHNDGYALRLRGVTTVTNDTTKPIKK